MNAACLGTAPPPQSDVGGPPLGAYRWQHKSAQGYNLQAFVLDRDALAPRAYECHMALRPRWRSGVRSRFARTTWRAWPPGRCARTAQDAPRLCTIQPLTHHAALLAACQRQGTPACQVMAYNCCGLLEMDTEKSVV